MRKTDITTEVAQCLIDTQFPLWSSLQVRMVDLDGWDNTTFRLGDDKSIRLPSADRYVPQIDKEHRWLSVLAPQLPLPIPMPLAKGVPGCSFPRPWSVYGWLEGSLATREQIRDLEEFAQDLARFLAALYSVPAADGPPAGDHSFNRGGPVQRWDEQTVGAISAMSGVIDVTRAKEVWAAAMGSAWSEQPVWVHGDVSPSNLLTIGGRLSGVLDFGCCAVGDPACDLTIAWTLFDRPSARRFRTLLPLDAGTWDRARGWALWKAGISHVQALMSNRDPEQAGVGFGWARSPRLVINRVLADFEEIG
jgi:aminoglycoside phosphotransferase (APT) family kinase protein